MYTVTLIAVVATLTVIFTFARGKLGERRDSLAEQYPQPMIYETMA